METKELDIKKNTLEQQAAKLRKQRRRQMLASTSDWSNVLQLQT